MTIINSVRGRLHNVFIVVCHRAQYLAHSSLIFSLMTFSASWLLAIRATTLMIILSYIQDFHHVQKYLEIFFEILENWFYENYMVLTPRKRELMRFGKTNENEVFTYREIRLSKITTEKLLGITIDEHLNNSDIVFLFGCLILLGLTE